MQAEASLLHGRILTLERLLSAVEFEDCTAKLSKGRAAWRGLWKTIGAKGDVASLSFEAAVKLGSQNATGREGTAASVADPGEQQSAPHPAGPRAAA